VKVASPTHPSKLIRCPELPCRDVDTRVFTVPNVELDSSRIRIFMITEAPPANSQEYFYASGKPFYLETTLKAFTDAGCHVASMRDIIDRGVYLTTAVKCGKTGYSVSSPTVDTCSQLVLEKELSLFPNLRAYLLMGDLAIKGFNYVATRATGTRVIPTGSTYKIRKGTYYYDDRRVYPSYLITGKSYLIEKSKQKMIAQDIESALALT
jgi:uracil-DNA glycosylase